MRAIIKNYKGIERADLELTGIVGIFGPNHSGKSSTARALGETLTKSVLQPKDRNDRPRAGGEECRIVIRDEDSSIEMSFPSNKPMEQDWQIKTTPESAGMVRLPELSAKEMAQFLADTLKTAPTKEDFIKAVKPGGFNEKEIDKVWDFICKNGADGWTKAHSSYKDEGTQIKGKWSQITGKAFEPAQGGSWLPNGWEQDLDAESEENLSKAISDEQHALEELIRFQSVSEAELGDLQEKFLGLDRLRPEHELAIAKSKKLMEEHNAAREAYAKLPKPVNEKEPITKQCAYCGEHNAEVNGVLVKRDAVTKTDTEKNAALQKALDEAKEAGAVLGEQAKAALTEEIELRHKVEEAEKAGEKLRASKVGGDQSKAIEAQRARIEKAQTRLAAFKKRRDASAQFDSFKRNEFLVKQLDVSGIRQQKAAKALSQFNDTLEKISEQGQWPATRIASDMSIAYGGRNYMNCSESEKFRCRVVMQLAAAWHQQAQIIIIDAADILDNEGRGQLFGMLEGFPFTTVLTCTKDEIDDCNDYRAAGLGVSYWLQDGVAHEIKHDAEEET